jgi:hypothetical protein
MFTSFPVGAPLVGALNHATIATPFASVLAVKPHNRRITITRIQTTKEGDHKGRPYGYDPKQSYGTELFYRGVVVWLC